MDILLALLLLIVSILAAVVPAVVYSLIVWWLDKYEKEPWGLLAVTFIWGAMPAVFLALVAEILFGIPFSVVFGEAVEQVIQGSAVAPIVEEVVKGLAVFFIFLIFRAEFDGPLDGIVYGALVGFGFGMTENIFYFLGGFVEGGAVHWLMVIFMRTILFGLNHGLFTSITGLGFGYASIADTAWKRWLAPPLALGGAIIVHAVHNTFTGLAVELCWPILISLLSDWGGVIIIALMVFLTWDREKRWIVQELKSEIDEGIISQADYEIVASYSRRVATQWGTLSKHGLRQARKVRKLHQLITELAFKKHRLRALGDTGRAEAEIARLREKIKDLRAQVIGQSY
jgi:RsiW-degrading membrane proteinase PrsW (M82 family)